MDVVRRKHLTQRALTDLEEVVLDVLFEHDPTFLKPKQIGELIGIASASPRVAESISFPIFAGFWIGLNPEGLSSKKSRMPRGGLQWRALTISPLNITQISDKIHYQTF